MSNGFPSTQGAPLCNESVKQASVKNGEPAFAEAIAWQAEEFRVRFGIQNRFSVNELRYVHKNAGFMENRELKQECECGRKPLKTQLL